MTPRSSEGGAQLAIIIFSALNVPRTQVFAHAATYRAAI